MIMSQPHSDPAAIECLVRDNLNAVRARMARAAERSGRNAEAVTLVAVTKYAQPEWVQALLRLGHLELGENRPQQLEERARLFPSTVNWHLIGHLQRNKVRKTLPIVRLIHSLDSVSLVQAVDRIAGELGLLSEALLEVNVSGEASKGGFRPDDLRTAWAALRDLPRVSIRGLMTMAPLSDDPESARTVFRDLRRLRDELAGGSGQLPELSMGMTGDFEVAIEEGATLVRIGSALWTGLEEG